MNIVVVGHVDHGKSTLIGRLLYDTKSLPLDAIERAKKVSAEKGKTFEYAYLLDAFEEEQNQGITIDTTNIKFSSKKRDYVIIDAPGHKEFLKNMISGASNAEAALLIIDSKEGIQEQSKRHGFILSLLGIKKVFVIVNKMDLVNYSKEIFDNIEKNFSEFLSEIGIFPLGFIPISAINGENITKRSNNLNWYMGGTIIESIDGIQERYLEESKAFRMPIQDVYKFDDRRIIVGRVESGSLNVGDEVIIYPSMNRTVVESIEGWNEEIKERISYQMSVGITFRDEFFNKRGEIITKKGEDQVEVSNQFLTSVFWMGNDRLIKGKKYVLRMATSQVECEVVEINKVIDTATLESLGDKKYVNKNEVAEIVIKTKEKIAIDIFNNINNTGRFVLVDGYDIAGGGIIIQTNKEDKTNKYITKELTSIDEIKWAKEIFNRDDIEEIRLIATINRE
ncbi:MAG: sulfate adenylyltransferase subunit 1 [Clostridium sp.]